MIDIIMSFFLLVIYSIRYLFSTGENRKKAKADLKEFWTETDGQMLLVFFGTAAVSGIFVVIWLLSE
ncbi:hypothetical protein [Bacillus wiedmannii]|uniref:hypothetical protein n=1 Tax=Bacillus wiedmannii TaxID=1890302 RepID=UPI000BED5C47|nr:hypothetical protein [Bacillus wiedmannii]PDZ47411.1 hypothetical protein CON82_02865 [Bacillus wiedmannii]